MSETVTYIAIGAAVIAVIATVVRLLLLGVGVKAFRDFLRRRK